MKHAEEAFGGNGNVDTAKMPADVRVDPGTAILGINPLMSVPCRCHVYKTLYIVAGHNLV